MRMVKVSATAEARARTLVEGWANVDLGGVDLTRRQLQHLDKLVRYIALACELPEVFDDAFEKTIPLSRSFEAVEDPPFRIEKARRIVAEEALDALLYHLGLDSFVSGSTTDDNGEEGSSIKRREVDAEFVAGELSVLVNAMWGSTDEPDVEEIRSRLRPERDADGLLFAAVLGATDARHKVEASAKRQRDDLLAATGLALDIVPLDTEAPADAAPPTAFAAVDRVCSVLRMSREAYGDESRRGEVLASKVAAFEIQVDELKHQIAETEHQRDAALGDVEDLRSGPWVISPEGKVSIPPAAVEDIDTDSIFAHAVAPAWPLKS